MSLKKYLAAVQDVSLLTAEEESELARLAATGDREAKETLIKSNARFVVTIAKQYTNRGLALEDIIAEGNLGVVKAVETYNPEIHRMPFIAYAIDNIIHSIRKALRIR